MKKWFSKYGIGVLSVLFIVVVISGLVVMQKSGWYDLTKHTAQHKEIELKLQASEKERIEAEECYWTLYQKHSDLVQHSDNLEKDIGIWIDKSVELKKELNKIKQEKKDKFNDTLSKLKKELDIVRNALTETILDTEKPSEPNFTDIVQESVKSVVHISCQQRQGSGFIIDEHMIMTARHIVENVEDFEITSYNGVKVKATRAISSKKHDIAIIWVDEKLSNPAEIGSAKDCVLGQDIYAIGSPYGKINFNSLSKGIVSGLDRDLNFIDYYTGESYGWGISFTTDAAGHPGNSGCPVFTLDGKVRGVLVGGFSPVLIIVVPVDIILDDLEEIKLMFIQDEYEFEKAVDWAEEAWGY